MSKLKSATIPDHHKVQANITLNEAIDEEPDTVMDVVEPYLLQLGFIERTPQGRQAMQRAYDHLGIAYPKNEQPRLL